MLRRREPVKMTKPTVFNYQDHEKLKAENQKLLEEIENLRRDKVNLMIKTRILEDEVKKLTHKNVT